MVIRSKIMPLCGPTCKISSQVEIPKLDPSVAINKIFNLSACQHYQEVVDKFPSVCSRRKCYKILFSYQAQILVPVVNYIND